MLFGIALSSHLASIKKGEVNIMHATSNHHPSKYNNISAVNSIVLSTVAGTKAEWSGYMHIGKTVKPVRAEINAVLYISIKKCIIYAAIIGLVTGNGNVLRATCYTTSQGCDVITQACDVVYHVARSQFKNEYYLINSKLPQLILQKSNANRVIAGLVSQRYKLPLPQV